ncbi:acyl-CoA dehydrogenase [Ferruginivarius sediminum]|uniref:3-methylmercaptopropionyl-CoA dehydrogenase n=1 Tax=Ferruginivarius sediminum TaxID=2661937 RepID=A0A369TBE4_9PROT|nr:acyl-CoA dehydrogenase [Ferruginivarius sediminum]RDD62643.1 acyl-CoA dehydrogenase [Ferruginivarius sediminum]
MADYRAPVGDMRFVLRELADIGGLAQLPGYEHAEPELVDQILDEAGKLASDVLSPLNWSGDREGVQLDNGVVRTPNGFAEAYRAYVEAGWNALPFDADYGGQGLPWTVALSLMEMWNSANMAWALCPMLTVGAVELLQTHGSDWQRDAYLPKLISGEWTGTMNLTEPQAGSDVGALKTRAVKDGDHYRITGQKIFITWGEHDAAENVIHMVLARTPDAPAGTKGISLFIVPKYLPNEDGTPGPRNDLRCVSVEHKLGIHASPTCTMAFGDNEGAIGYLVGEENAGMKCMFTMMNNARLTVGVQGLAIAERAYQAARQHAFDRVQSRPLDGSASDAVPIARHPDVRRMLLTMRARVEAMRALAYSAGNALDRAKHGADEDARRAAQARVDLLTPIVKAWCTDQGVEVASIGIQVHGGMGFIEETGAAQHYRDARIAPIYEGTNGIQALDLMGRKVLRDGGESAGAYIAELRATLDDLDKLNDPDAKAIADALRPALDHLESATQAVLRSARDDVNKAAAVATPYLLLFGTVAGGTLLGRAAVSAHRSLSNGADYGRDFLEDKVAIARFYTDHILPHAGAYAAEVERGADSVLRLPEERL